MFERLSDWAVLSPVLIAIWAWVLIALERLFPYDRGQRLFRKGWFDDFFLYTLLQSYLLGHVINAVTHALDTSLGASRLRLVGGWPVWAQLALFFVTHDFYIYWFHRLQHRSPLLWRTHEAHHSVDDVDWLAGSRSHAVEILINQTIEFAPIVLLGAAPEIAFMKGTLDAVWGMWIHSNVGARTGVLQYVINGPEMHRWHHARKWEGHGWNFATKLAVWDWIFGTAHLPPSKPAGYGLDEPGYPDGYLRQQLYAFRRFASGDTEAATSEAPAASTEPRRWT